MDEMLKGIEEETGVDGLEGVESVPGESEAIAERVIGPLIVKIAGPAAIEQALGRALPSVARLTQAKAIVRFEVRDPRLDDELVALVSARYVFNRDGQLTGPYFGFDESWSQYKSGVNAAITAISKAASDLGVDIKPVLGKSRVTYFDSANTGDYKAVTGPFEKALRGFARQWSDGIERMVLAKEAPQRTY